MWVCSGCKIEHNILCNFRAQGSICQNTCYECGDKPCGLLDCAHYGDQGAHHVCVRCAIRLIEHRHPDTWNPRSDPIEKRTFTKPEHAPTRAAARFFLWLSNVHFLDELKGYCNGNRPNKWNNFQFNFNRQEGWRLQEGARVLSLLYHAVWSPPPIVISAEDEENALWPIAGIQTHSRALWVSLCTGTNYRALTSPAHIGPSSTDHLRVPNRMKTDAVLGSFGDTFDLDREDHKPLLSDGTPAIDLYQAICKKLDYKLRQYPSDIDCSKAPASSTGLPSRSVWDADHPWTIISLVTGLFNFTPWRTVSFGIVGLLLGLVLERVAKGGAIPLLT